MIEYTPKKITIETNGMTLVYDNSKLTSHQAQIALVIGQYIEDVNKNHKKDMTSLVNGDVSEAIDTIVSHLVLPVAEGETSPYNKDFATDTIKPALLTSPVELSDSKKEIVEDFFLSQKRSHLCSTLLQKEDWKAATEKLFLMERLKTLTNQSESATERQPEEPQASPVES
jgi:hypothetical protein